MSCIDLSTFCGIKHWNQTSTYIYLDSADPDELPWGGNLSGPALIKQESRS